MAVSVVSTTAVTGVKGSTSISTGAGAISVQTNDVILAIFAASNTSANPSAVTDGVNSYSASGATWQVNGTGGFLAAFAAQAISTTTLTVQATASSSGNLTLVVIVLRGADFSTISAGITDIVASSTSNTTPSATSDSVIVGDAVVGIIATLGPSGDTFTADADTTNGSWSAATESGTSGGSAGANSTLNVQTKVATGTGTQTYNPTLGTARWWLAGAIAINATSTSLSTLTDDFSTKDTAKWAWGTSGVSGGSAVVLSGTGVFTSSVYSLTDASAYVDWVAPTANSSLKYFGLQPSNTNLTALRSAFFSCEEYVGGGLVKASYGDGSTVNLLATVAYSSDTRYCRIRESGGTVYWDTSPDGSTWTNLASVATTTLETALGSPIRGLYCFVRSGDTSSQTFDGISVVGASSGTPIGDTSQIIYKTRGIAADTSQVIANTRGLATDSSQLIAKVRTTLGDTSQVIAKVRALAGDTSQVIAKTLGIATDSFQIQANTRQALYDALQVIYPVRQIVTGGAALAIRGASAPGSDSISTTAASAVAGDTCFAVVKISCTLDGSTGTPDTNGFASTYNGWTLVGSIARNTSWPAADAVGVYSKTISGTETFNGTSTFTPNGDDTWLVGVGMVAISGTVSTSGAGSGSYANSSSPSWSTTGQSGDILLTFLGASSGSQTVPPSGETELFDNAGAGVLVAVSWETQGTPTSHSSTMSGANPWQTLPIYVRGSGAGGATERQLIYNTRGIAGDQEQLVYNVAAYATTLIGDESQIIWKVAAAASDSSQIIYKVRFALGDQEQLIAKVSTTLGDQEQVIYKARYPLGDTSQVIVKVATTLADQEQLVYKVRTLAGDSSQVIFKVRGFASDQEQLVFKTTGQIFDTSQFIYKVVGQATDSSILRFATRNFLGDTSQVIFKVRGLASDQEQLVHKVATSFFDTFQFVAATRNFIGDASQVVWNTATLAGDQEQLLYNVLAYAGVAFDTSQLVWNVRGLATDDFVPRFATRNFLGDTSQVIWKTRLIAGDQEQLISKVVGQIFDTSQLVFKTRGLATDTSQLIYKVRLAVTDQEQLIYKVAQALGNQEQLIYKVRQAVTDQGQLIYKVRGLASDTSQVIFKVRGIAGDSSQIIYNVRAYVGYQEVLRYAVRLSVLDNSQIVWKVGAQAGDEATVVFHTLGMGIPISIYDVWGISF